MAQDSHSIIKKSNVSSKVTEPILTKLNMEPPWVEGRNFCSSSPGHMTNMAAMPIHGKKNIKSSSLEPADFLP